MTERGRARSARNSLRHGLSLPVASDAALSEEVEALAREIAGLCASPEVRELAHKVAEAQIDLCRVRYARHQLLLQAIGSPYYESRASTRKKVKILRYFLRRNAPDISSALLERYLSSTPQGPQKFATILSEELRRLAMIDRYERRALSRRKFAVRALDEARSS